MSSSAPPDSRPGPAISTRAPDGAVDARARSHRAAEGATLIGTSVSAGTSAQGVACNRPGSERRPRARHRGDVRRPRAASPAADAPRRPGRTVGRGRPAAARTGRTSPPARPRWRRPRRRGDSARLARRAHAAPRRRRPAPRKSCRRGSRPAVPASKPGGVARGTREVMGPAAESHAPGGPARRRVGPPWLRPPTSPRRAGDGVERSAARSRASSASSGGWTGG